MTNVLEVVAAPTRQRILELCWDQELPAGAIAAQSRVTFGAISQHLKILHRHGLVSRRKEGRHRIYRADRQALGPLAAVLESQWTTALGRLKHLAETEERNRRKPRT